MDLTWCFQFDKITSNISIVEYGNAQHYDQEAVTYIIPKSISKNDKIINNENITLKEILVTYDKTSSWKEYFEQQYYAVSQHFANYNHIKSIKTQYLQFMNNNLNYSSNIIGFPVFIATYTKMNTLIPRLFCNSINGTHIWEETLAYFLREKVPISQDDNGTISLENILNAGINFDINSSYTDTTNTSTNTYKTDLFNLFEDIDGTTSIRCINSRQYIYCSFDCTLDAIHCISQKFDAHFQQQLVGINDNSSISSVKLTENIDDTQKKYITYLLTDPGTFILEWTIELEIFLHKFPTNDNLFSIISLSHPSHNRFLKELYSDNSYPDIAIYVDSQGYFRVLSLR